MQRLSEEKQCQINTLQRKQRDNDRQSDCKLEGTLQMRVLQKKRAQYLYFVLPKYVYVRKCLIKSCEFGEWRILQMVFLLVSPIFRQTL